jgi:hypothetical protein
MVWNTKTCRLRLNQANPPGASSLEALLSRLSLSWFGTMSFIPLMGRGRKQLPCTVLLSHFNSLNRKWLA